jgi:hypothetical protein
MIIELIITKLRVINIIGLNERIIIEIDGISVDWRVIIIQFLIGLKLATVILWELNNCLFATNLDSFILTILNS